MQTEATVDIWWWLDGVHRLNCCGTCICRPLRCSPSTHKFLKAPSLSWPNELYVLSMTLLGREWVILIAFPWMQFYIATCYTPVVWGMTMEGLPAMKTWDDEFRQWWSQFTAKATSTRHCLCEIDSWKALNRRDPNEAPTDKKHTGGKTLGSKVLEPVTRCRSRA